MDTAKNSKSKNRKYGFGGVILALAACIALAAWAFPEEKELPRVQPGAYWAEEILYSTISSIPEGETVRDLFNCKVMEDDKFLIQHLYETDGASQWITIGKLEPCEFTNEYLADLIQLPNTWISGSLEDIGTITDARSVTHDKSGGTYLLFCTEDGGNYFAKCSQLGNEKTVYISYLARLSAKQLDQSTK